MKSIILALTLTLMTIGAVHAETKKVCEKTIDAKTKKEKEVCKTITIHKKLDGTVIPEKK